jgi:hypothetical protein
LPGTEKHHAAWIGPATPGNQALKHAVWKSDGLVASFDLPDSFMIQNPASYRAALDAVGVAHVARFSCTQTLKGAPPPPPCLLSYCTWGGEATAICTSIQPDDVLPHGFIFGELLAFTLDRDRAPHLLVSAQCNSLCQHPGPYLFHLHGAFDGRKSKGGIWRATDLSSQVRAFCPAEAISIKALPSLVVDDAELVADEKGDLHAAILGHFSSKSRTWSVVLAGTMASGQDKWKLVKVDSDARDDVALAVSGRTAHVAYFRKDALVLSRVGL